MDRVTPEYIRGQKRRLERERRYSHGLLLTVIRCNDHLPRIYLPYKDADSQTDITDTEPECEAESDLIPFIQADPSIHEPLSENGMTAAKAWCATLDQLKIEMPKAAYSSYVRDLAL